MSEGLDRLFTFKREEEDSTIAEELTKLLGEIHTIWNALDAVANRIIELEGRVADIDGLTREEAENTEGSE